VTATGGPGRIGRQERIARAALGMLAEHPELLTRKPSRAEWQQLATWCAAEPWPNDQYTAIVGGRRCQSPNERT
jgi:hypothetical protein